MSDDGRTTPVDRMFATYPDIEQLGDAGTSRPSKFTPTNRGITQGAEMTKLRHVDHPDDDNEVWVRGKRGFGRVWVRIASSAGGGDNWVDPRPEDIMDRRAEYDRLAADYETLTARCRVLEERAEELERGLAAPTPQAGPEVQAVILGPMTRDELLSVASQLGEQG